MFLKKTISSQKGAMFGMDARIALAIFGGLSVIAGVSMVSVISETNVTALVTEFDNISKGYTNHAFDTGADVTAVDTVASESANFLELIDNTGGLLGWNGPYISMSSTSQTNYGVYGIHSGRLDGAAAATPAACVAGDVCAVWLHLTGVPDPIAVTVDSTIDGASTPTTGNVRVTSVVGSNDDIYFMLSRTLIQP